MSCYVCYFVVWYSFFVCPHCLISQTPPRDEVGGICSMKASAYCVVVFNSPRPIILIPCNVSRCFVFLLCVSAARTHARTLLFARPPGPAYQYSPSLPFPPALTPLLRTGTSLHAKSLFVPSLLITPLLLHHFTWSIWPPPRRRQCGLLPGLRIGALRSTRSGR